MKLSRTVEHRIPRANMTPMIDVTFLLLIFFMCTMQFRTLDAKLGAFLPKDAGAGRPASVVERIRIRVDVLAEGTRLAPDGAEWNGRGTFAYGADRALRYTVGPSALGSLADVERTLARLHAANPERGVTIDARADTVYADVVPVLDTCVLLGFEDVSFAGAR